MSPGRSFNNLFHLTSEAMKPEIAPEYFSHYPNNACITTILKVSVHSQITVSHTSSEVHPILSGLPACVYIPDIGELEEGRELMMRRRRARICLQTNSCNLFPGTERVYWSIAVIRRQ